MRFLPKGWPKARHDLAEMAAQEALEEAGIRSHVLTIAAASIVTVPAAALLSAWSSLRCG